MDLSSQTLGEFNDPWLRALVNKGLTLASRKDANLLVNINHTNRFLDSKSRIPKVLIRTEPISVFPAQYSSRIENQYNLIITIGLPRRKVGKFLNFPHPYRTMSNPNIPDFLDLEIQNEDQLARNQMYSFTQWEKRRIYISLVAANKVSSRNESNYELRRRFAEYSKFNKLEIFGGLWNAELKTKIHHRIGVGIHAMRNGTLPNLKSLYGGLHKKYDNYMGTPRNKQLIMQESKFALVIENSNTYVSEKLFDAFVGGSIPVYFGPDLSNYGIAEELLVVRHEGNPNQLYSRLATLSKTEIDVRLKAIKHFLDSSAFRNDWAADTVFSEIAAEIARFCSKS